MTGRPLSRPVKFITNGVSVGMTDGRVPDGCWVITAEEYEAAIAKQMADQFGDPTPKPEA